MNRTSTLALSAIATVGLAMLPSQTPAQQKSLKEQLVGAWTVVSSNNVAPDGSKRQLFGSNPTGVVILDASGRYAQILVRPGRPKFVSNNRMQGTPEENKAAQEGAVAHHGTWTVNETDKTVVLKIETAVYPNQDGTEAKRTISSVTTDELKWVNPASGAGGTTETVWRRAK
jgi:Lipocalin-like domain